MKLRFPVIVLVAGLLSHGIAAASTDGTVEQTTVCEIVSRPADFIGKTVEVRAQIWADDRFRDFFWMNESSLQLDKVCPFLHASIAPGRVLADETAFGTFRGRLAQELGRSPSTLVGPRRKGARILFLVDGVSDLRLRRVYRSGPTPTLQLYDRESAGFVRPEN